MNSKCLATSKSRNIRWNHNPNCTTWLLLYETTRIAQIKVVSGCSTDSDYVSIEDGVDSRDGPSENRFGKNSVLQLRRSAGSSRDSQKIDGNVGTSCRTRIGKFVGNSLAYCVGNRNCLAQNSRKHWR